MMALHFVTNSGTIAVLGTFNKISKADLKLYIKRFPVHWVGV